MVDGVSDGTPDVDDADALVGEGEKSIGLVLWEVLVDAPQSGLFSLVDVYAKLHKARIASAARQ